MFGMNTNIDLEKIIHACQKTDYNEKDIYEELLKINEDILQRIFINDDTKENLSEKERNYLSSYHFDPRFMNQMTIYSKINPLGHFEEEKENFIEFIGPCYNTFLYNVLFSLNIFSKTPVKDNEDLSNKMIQKIKELKEIKTEEELKKQFPFIYKEYQETNLNLEEFINCQTRLYKSYVKNRKEYKQAITNQTPSIESIEYRDTVLKYLEKMKVELYIAYHYLLKGEEIVEKYQKNEDSKVEIEVKKIINKILTLERNYISYMYGIARYLSVQPNIEVEENKFPVYIEIYDIINSFTKLKEKAQPSKYEIIKDLINVKKQPVGEKPFFEREKTKRKGESKNQFYKDSYPAMIISSPNNYRAYIYLNGKVVLDTEYDSNKKKNAIGTAAYIISSGDFKSFLKLSFYRPDSFVFNKTILDIKIKEKTITKIIHQGAWQQRIEEEISKIPEEDPTADIIEIEEMVKAYRKK